MALLLNALSNDPFYNRHYADVREKWAAKLEESGASLIAQARSVISMSTLCSEFSRMKIMNLDEIIRFFADAANLQSNLQELLPHREVFHACFKMLKSFELDKTWESRVKPYLEGEAEHYRQVMNKTYPLEEMERAINRFLGAPRPICSRIYLAAYIKPIAFQLPNGGMAMHPRPRGDMYLPKQLACLVLHESLHGFPDSMLAQERQSELQKANHAFEEHDQAWIAKYNSGPEEYFVVGAEAYLSLKLQLRTHEACVEYLETQNEGMPVSYAIYEALRDAGPEQANGWSGYGQWLHKHIPEIIGSSGSLG